MSEADRNKWDGRYRDGSYRGRTYPTALVEQWLPAAAGARALDVACGSGRNALFLASAGYRVDAVDISSFALETAKKTADERGLTIQWMETDLDAFVPETSRYGVIVVARYMNRKLMPRLSAGLRPGGMLIFEHHIRTECAVNGPRGLGFRLDPNELLRQYLDLEVRFYKEAISEDPDGRTMALAQLVAVKQGTKS